MLRPDKQIGRLALADGLHHNGIAVPFDTNILTSDRGADDRFRKLDETEMVKCGRYRNDSIRARLQVLELLTSTS